MTIMGAGRWAAVLAGALLATSVAACSSSDKTFTFCTDPNYPPAEFHQVGKVGSAELKRQLVGADIDIAHDVAKRIDRSVRYTETPFTGIIPALLDQRCDAIISFMNDTPERRKQLAFVDYLQAGQSVMIAKDAAPGNRALTLVMPTGRTAPMALTIPAHVPGISDLKVLSAPNQPTVELQFAAADESSDLGTAPYVWFTMSCGGEPFVGAVKGKVTPRDARNGPSWPSPRLFENEYWILPSLWLKSRRNTFAAISSDVASWHKADHQ